MPFTHRMEKMCFINIMEYCSVIRNKDILKFAVRWIEFEIIMLNEATQTQKDMQNIHSLIRGY